MKVQNATDQIHGRAVTRFTAGLLVWHWVLVVNPGLSQPPVLSADGGCLILQGHLVKFEDIFICHN